MIIGLSTKIIRRHHTMVLPGIDADFELIRRFWVEIGHIAMPSISKILATSLNRSMQTSRSEHDIRKRTRHV